MFSEKSESHQTPYKQENQNIPKDICKARFYARLAGIISARIEEYDEVHQPGLFVDPTVDALAAFGILSIENLLGQEKNHHVTGKRLAILGAVSTGVLALGGISEVIKLHNLDKKVLALLCNSNERYVNLIDGITEEQADKYFSDAVSEFDQLSHLEKLRYHVLAGGNAIGRQTQKIHGQKLAVNSPIVYFLLKKSQENGFDQTPLQQGIEFQTGKNTYNFEE